MSNIGEGMKVYLTENNYKVNSENIDLLGDELSELAENFYHTGEYTQSVFTPDENTEVTREDFYEIIEAATRENGYDKEQADLLFDVLNTNGGDTLSYDELKILANKEGIITDTSMWGSIYGAVDSKIVLKSSSSTSTTGSADTTGTTDTTSETVTSSLETGSDTPDSSVLPLETDSENSASTGKEYSTLTEAEAKEYATMLYNATAGRWGTDEETVDSILDDLSPDDLAYVIIVYDQMYKEKSFVQAIDDDYSGGEQEEVFNKITTKLVTAAENGNEGAINLITMELHYATGKRNGTAEDFVEGILGDNKASDGLVRKIVQRYEAINGVTLSADIDGDFSGKTKKKYLARVSTAMSSGSD